MYQFAPSISLDLASQNLAVDLEHIRTGGTSRVDLRFGYPVPKICFTHIHKTGGSTFERVLKQFYAEREQEEHATAGLDGLSLLYGHYANANIVDESWSIVTLTRDPKRRLRSHLPSVLGNLETSSVLGNRNLSPIPDADLDALSRGGLPEILGRDDAFSVELTWKSSNLLTREFLGCNRNLSGFLKKSRNSLREYLSSFESLDEDELRRQATERLSRYAFVGCLEALNLSIAILMWKYGLPAQQNIPTMRQMDLRTKEKTQQIVDSIPAEKLEKLIGLDRVIDSILRQRFADEREAFFSAIKTSDTSLDKVNEFVTRSFEKQFSKHIAERVDQAVNSFKIEPGDPLLGWGLGNVRAASDHKRACYIVAEESTFGFYTHMQPHMQGCVFVLCRGSLAPRRGSAGLSARVNGVDCKLSHVLHPPNPELDRGLMWLGFTYNYEGPLQKPGMYKFEFTTASTAGRSPLAVYTIIGATKRT